MEEKDQDQPPISRLAVVEKGLFFVFFIPRRDDAAVHFAL